MAAVLRRSLQKTCTNVGLMNMKAENELESFLMVSMHSFRYRFGNAQMRAAAPNDSEENMHIDEIYSFC